MRFSEYGFDDGLVSEVYGRLVYSLQSQTVSLYILLHERGKEADVEDFVSMTATCYRGVIDSAIKLAGERGAFQARVPSIWKLLREADGGSLRSMRDKLEGIVCDDEVLFGEYCKLLESYPSYIMLDLGFLAGCNIDVYRFFDKGGEMLRDE